MFVSVVANQDDLAVPNTKTLSSSESEDSGVCANAKSLEGAVDGAEDGAVPEAVPAAVVGTVADVLE
jgi:hypothetical protein